MPEKEYDLDMTAEEGAREAERLRLRDIPWEEQEPFFKRHLRMFGHLGQLALIRAERGYPKYRDNTFWFPKKLLMKMLMEELLDAIIYFVIDKYRHELIGNYPEVLGDDPYKDEDD